MFISCIDDCRLIQETTFGIDKGQARSTEPIKVVRKAFFSMILRKNRPWFRNHATGPARIAPQSRFIFLIERGLFRASVPIFRVMLGAA
jgi:hypothetical protein